ncbi:uroporphyrinogen-III C-methyltransferase [Ferrimicrobium sp.]|uniref:uroporphyrinogen-III C-methyltransferase n=1 Tax=Ferrimicrobium sp. TaxID=2926050 RepID=UPI002619D0A5|nr:uroporphyrinogen-III C-methyltransferase [Ferrimicrobium sp.]
MARVALVGAGPGDPGLITVRGLELLTAADVVVTDFLVDNRLKQLIPEGVDIVDVGKRPGATPSHSQDAINRELIQLSRSHGLVVRLKGGDPFLFGRGGEEVDALLAAGISVEVVPGVTSALAGPAYAGVPVTHRGLADGYIVITGHRHADVPLDYDWSALVASKLTIVVLMGVAGRRLIAGALLAAGMSPTTPTVVIESVTWPQERSIRTTIGELAGEEIRSPAVIIIGATAGLRLDWRGSLPLAGSSIHLLRPFDPNDGLATKLRQEGAAVIQSPAIEIHDPSDGGRALHDAMHNIEQYDWLVFTSKNGVERALREVVDLRRLANIKIAVIGSGTRTALQRYRVGSDLMPAEFIGEALVDSFPNGPGRVLFPRARVAREVVPDGLRAKGWSVDVVEAYQICIPPPLMTGEIASAMDVTVFTAASTVTGYREQYPGVRPKRAVAIGPVTADRLRDLGAEQIVVADQYSVEGLAEVIRGLVSSLAHG